MARRKAAPPRPVTTRVAGADLDRLLDQYEEAMLASQTDQVSTLTAQLWQGRRRLPEILTERLIAGRSKIPALVFQLLEGIAGQRAPSYLRRVAQDRRALDIVRFGAQRRAGWPERGETKRRLAFLESLRDADATLVAAIDQGSAPWPPDSEILQESLAYLIILPSARRRQIVTHAVHELGLRMAWLLHALLHVDDPATQRLALSELTGRRDPSAAGPVERLARMARDPAIRAEAEAAARRLGWHVVDREQQPEPVPLPPVDRAVLTSLDGDGGQAMLVIRRWGEQLFLVADFFHNENWGVKDAFGIHAAHTEEVDFLTDTLSSAEVEGIDVEIAAVRGALTSAIEVNVAAGHPIPPVFELWEPLVHDSYPPPADELVTVPELDDMPYADRADLIRAAGGLAEHRFFESWLFDPEDVMAATEGVPSPSIGGRLTDRHYRAFLEKLLPAPTRARLRNRLRRQAWLLDRFGDTTARDLALATAATLARGNPAELGKHPFLRKMLERAFFAVIAAVPLEFGIESSSPWY